MYIKWKDKTEITNLNVVKKNQIWTLLNEHCLKL